MKNFAALVVVLIIAAGVYYLDDISRSTLKTHLVEDNSRVMTKVAKGMSTRLGQDMNARASEIEFLTQIDMIREPETPLEVKLELFENMKKSYPYYAWIGMTDAQGNILTGTDGLLVGKNVAKRDWFIYGSKGLHFGDAHDEFLLAKLMPKPKWDDLPLRLVDVSAPVLNDQGELVGVICGHLSMDWAFEARNVMQADIGNDKVDLLVLNDTGKVLMGSAFLPSLKTDLSDMDSWKKIESGEDVVTENELWADGISYSTTIVSAENLHSKLPIKWSVLARVPSSTIHQPLAGLQQVFMMTGIAMAILSLFVIIFMTGNGRRN